MHIEKKKTNKYDTKFSGNIRFIYIELDGAMLYPLHIFDHNRISQWFASF